MDDADGAGSEGLDLHPELLGRIDPPCALQLLPADAPLNDDRFIPVQFSLPRQKKALLQHVEAATLEAMQQGLPRPCYIVKPDVGSHGDGISLTSDPERKSWPAGQERVVQEYVARPMLVDGLKFDLRLYVLVADTPDLSLIHI